MNHHQTRLSQGPLLLTPHTANVSKPRHAHMLFVWPCLNVVSHPSVSALNWWERLQILVVSASECPAPPSGICVICKLPKWEQMFIGHRMINIFLSSARYSCQIQNINFRISPHLPYIFRRTYAVGKALTVLFNIHRFPSKQRSACSIFSFILILWFAYSSSNSFIHSLFFLKNCSPHTTFSQSIAHRFSISISSSKAQPSLKENYLIKAFGPVSYLRRCHSKHSLDYFSYLVRQNTLQFWRLTKH